MIQEIESLTENDLKDLVLKEISKLNDVKIYYECRRLGGYLVRSISYIKMCIALTNLSLPINVYVLSFISGKTYDSVMRTIHVLGDKNILVYKRRRIKKRGCFEWMINPSFLEKVL